MAPRKRGTKPDTTAGFSPPYRLQREHRDQAEALLVLEGQLAQSSVHPDFLADLRRKAATLNTHATTSIEGNPLDRRAVEAIALAPRRTSREVAEVEVRNHLGYYAGLSRMAPGPLTPAEIQRTHEALLAGVLPWAPGSWKTSQNVIQDEAGRDVFYPTPPRRVEQELGALNAWFEESPLPTPVRVAIWTHEFFCIHPFKDGNGRVGRALTHRLLSTNGMPGIQYVGLDAQFLAHRRRYMEAIESVQDDAWDHAPWVTFFLGCLRDAYQEAIDAVTSYGGVAEDLDGLKRAIMRWVVERGGATFARVDFLRAPAGKAYHPVSVSQALSRLVDQEYLEPDGAGRGRVYRPGARFREALLRDGD